MDLTLLLALLACALSAGLVYVFMQVRHFNEAQSLQGQLLVAQDELEKTKKKLQGYTQYSQHVDGLRKVLQDALKAPVAKLSREVTHVEAVNKDVYKLKADATVVATYQVDYAYAIDTSTNALEITDSGSAVLIRLAKPTLQGDAVIRAAKKKVISAVALADDKAVLGDAHARSVVQIKRLGSALAGDEGLRAQCKIKAQDAVREHLAQASGVRSVPSVVVEFR